MERRRIPYERERWLSAVLIVTAIAGASVVVPRWPLAVSPALPAVPRLSARSLPLSDAPGVLSPVPLSQVRPSGPLAGRAPVSPDAPAVTVAANEIPRTAPLPSPASMVLAGGEVHQETAVLASRRVDLAGVVHPLTEDDPLAAAASPLSASHAFVDIPAVVVTRVVMVAGRGIRSGIRATGAVFRAAF